jgi:hypothetical protein
MQFRLERVLDELVHEDLGIATGIPLTVRSYRSVYG